MLSSRVLLGVQPKISFAFVLSATSTAESPALNLYLLHPVLSLYLESTLSDLANPKALNGRHASGGIIANLIQSCQGNAIIKSINGEYIGNSLVSKSEIMDASGGVIVNTATIKAINNSIFKNNYASSVNGTNAHGGAIYTRQDLVTQKCGEVWASFLSSIQFSIPIYWISPTH